ncbi:MAG: type IV secretion protein IcmD [Gammaproteobacteria bacterium]|nr:type IV secretion protein IcmD [Gammaproteobacteria bacterium]
MFNTKIFGLLIYFTCCLTYADEAKTIKDIFNNLSGSLGSITGLLFSLATIAGISFSIAAMFKFKQHKDNPQQISVGQPIGLFFLGVIMLWLPYMIQAIGYTITGAKNTGKLREEQSTINTPDTGFSPFIIENPNKN